MLYLCTYSQTYRTKCLSSSAASMSADRQNYASRPPPAATWISFCTQRVPCASFAAARSCGPTVRN